MVCNWYVLENIWEADCGFSLELDDPGLEDNDFYFCPKCGARIIQMKAL